MVKVDAQIEMLRAAQAQAAGRKPLWITECKHSVFLCGLEESRESTLALERRLQAASFHADNILCANDVNVYHTVCLEGQAGALV